MKLRFFPRNQKFFALTRQEVVSIVKGIIAKTG